MASKKYPERVVVWCPAGTKDRIARIAEVRSLGSNSDFIRDSIESKLEVEEFILGYGKSVPGERNEG